MKILLCGFTGLMGECLQALFEQRDGFQVVGHSNGSSDGADPFPSEGIDVLVVAVEKKSLGDAEIMSKVGMGKTERLSIVPFDLRPDRAQPAFGAASHLPDANLKSDFDRLVSEIEDRMCRRKSP